MPNTVPDVRVIKYRAKGIRSLPLCVSLLRLYWLGWNVGWYSTHSLQALLRAESFLPAGCSLSRKTPPSSRRRRRRRRRQCLWNLKRNTVNVKSIDKDRSIPRAGNLCFISGASKLVQFCSRYFFVFFCLVGWKGRASVRPSYSCAATAVFYVISQGR